MPHSLFYDWKHYLKRFGLGGVVKPREDKGSATKEIMGSGISREIRVILG